MPASGRHPRACNDARCRSGFDQVGWLSPRGFNGHDPATREHDVNPPTNASVAKAGCQRAKVALDNGTHVGVNHRGAGALVLANLGENFVRAGDENVLTECPAKRLRQPLLMLRIGIRMQQANRDALDPGRRKLLRRGVHIALIQGFPLLPPRPEAPDYLQAQTPRDQGRRLAVLQVIEHWDAQATHFEDVSKAGSGNQRSPRPLVLENGVGGHRSGMHQVGNRFRRIARAFEQHANAGKNTQAVVIGG